MSDIATYITDTSSERKTMNEQNNTNITRSKALHTIGLYGCMSSEDLRSILELPELSFSNETVPYEVQYKNERNKCINYTLQLESLAHFVIGGSKELLETFQECMANGTTPDGASANNKIKINTDWTYDTVAILHHFGQKHLYPAEATECLDE